MQLYMCLNTCVESVESAKTHVWKAQKVFKHMKKVFKHMKKVFKHIEIAEYQWLCHTFAEILSEIGCDSANIRLVFSDFKRNVWHNRWKLSE
jgi:C4-dicarboxylate transporter